MNDDKFLKEVLKYGKIRPVEDAFKEFPVEEEIHKGEIDNYIGVAEDYEEYNINFKYNVQKLAVFSVFCIFVFLFFKI